MNDVVEVFSPIVSTTSRGVVRKIWGDVNGEVGDISLPGGIPEGGSTLSTSTLVETITADVQPKSLSEYELRVYGISNIPNDSKVMYYQGFSSNLVAGNRARVNSTEMYEIRGVQSWTMHTECLLVPVVGYSNA